MRFKKFYSLNNINFQEMRPLALTREKYTQAIYKPVLSTGKPANQNWGNMKIRPDPYRRFSFFRLRKFEAGQISKPIWN